MRSLGSYFLLVLSFSLPAWLLAQSTQSTILGTVRDASGAVIPSAQLVITDTDKGTSASYTTGAGGNYQAQDLPPGRYKLEVTKAGFQTKVIEGLVLTARQELRIDVNLEVGATVQQVTVNAATAGAIDTETSSIAASLNTQSVMNLPANFRASGSTSPLNLIQTLPGVQPDTGPGTTTPIANGSPNINFSVQGGLPFQTETSVDGISTQNVRQNSPLSDAFPSADSVAEIRVDGVNNNAEFGQMGEVTTVTKSGTDQLHGGLFWYHQNRALDAVAFGTPVNPVTGQAEKPQKIGNDFGASVGGPVDIPHLYNGHDKTFFFGTYEGFRFPRQSPIQDLVPTQLMQEGNFSQEVPYLLDPYTFGLYPNTTVSPISASANPFLKFFPQPNVANYTTLAAAEAGTGYNYAQNRESSYNSNQFDTRIDQRFSEKLQGFARFTFKNLDLLAPQDLNIQSITDFDNYRILAGSLVYSFSPNLVNEFRFGLTFEHNGLRNSLDGAPITAAAGFDPVGANEPANGATEIYFPGLTTLAAGNLNSTSMSHLVQYADNLSWAKGKHTLKFGVDIRTFESLTTLGAYGINNVEVFAFTGQITSYPNAPAVANEYADFLAGTPVETQYYTLIPKNDGRSIGYGFYAEDEWKALPKLTISYGLRYEYHPAYHDTQGAIGNFDPTNAGTGAVVYPDGHQNLLDPSFLDSFDACGYGPTSTAYANCTPVLSNSQDNLPSSLRRSQRDRILPRAGFAWRPFNDDKTAVRAGFGMYNTTTMGSIFFSLTDTLQAATNVYTNSLTPTGLAYTWPETSPGGALSPAYGTAGMSTADQINWKDPLSYQWNVSIDHQFAGNIGTRISYIAMQTNDLSFGPNLNDMSYSSTTPATERPLTDRPFPNWGAVDMLTPTAQANYESLQLAANRRFQGGFTFESTYTWAKNLADNQGPAPSSFVGETGSYSGGVASPQLNRLLFYGNVYGTRRQRWITTAVYDLPFGRGKRFGANMNRLENGMLGGWRLSNIFLLQTGPYLSAYIPSGDADPSGDGSGILYNRPQHPDLVGNTRPAHRSASEWVNSMAFACPSNSGYTATSYAGNPCGVGVTSNPIGRFGNEGVGDIVGPGTVNWSAGLNRQIAITERAKLSVEVTFTNVLNHTNLNDPALDITNPNFGKIFSARGSDFGGNRTGQISLRLEF